MASSFSIAEKEENNNMGLQLSPSPNLCPYPSPVQKLPTKKRGTFNLLRAATFMVRRRSAGNKAPVHAEVVDGSQGKGLWKNLVNGIRPLHHHHLEHGVPPTPNSIVATTTFDSFHDVSLPPPSPSSSVDGMSRYASADDLQALDTSENEDDVDSVGGDGRRNAIDLKAEEFIAKFYEQMRLQRLESMSRYNGAC